MVNYYTDAKKVLVTDITGIDSAYRSLLQTMNSWTPEIEKDIQASWLKYYTTGECDEFMKMMCDKIVKYGVGTSGECGIGDGHETLLRFIDIHIHVIELHRGAMDDFDSHAMNMSNRIVRRSTRIVKPGQFPKNKSEWYNGKILNVTDVGDLIPSEIDYDGQKWVLGMLGNYIREDLVGQQDVERGNYPMGLPMGCTSVINLHSLRHIYKRRNVFTHAAPELQEMIEELATKLEELLPSSISPCIRNDWVLLEQPDSTFRPGWAHIAKVQKVSFMD